MRAPTEREPASPPLPHHRLPPAESARAVATGLVPATGGRRDQARSRRSGSPHAPSPHRIRQASRSLLAALCAWLGEQYGIDPIYLAVLLVASVQLGVQRILGGVTVPETRYS
jgi:hypothetical protein